MRLFCETAVPFKGHRTVCCQVATCAFLKSFPLHRYRVIARTWPVKSPRTGLTGWNLKLYKGLSIGVGLPCEAGVTTLMVLDDSEEGNEFVPRGTTMAQSQ